MDLFSVYTTVMAWKTRNQKRKGKAKLQLPIPTNPPMRMKKTSTSLKMEVMKKELSWAAKWKNLINMYLKLTALGNTLCILCNTRCISSMMYQILSLHLDCYFRFIKF